MALLAGRASVKYNPERITPQKIAKEIEGLGFTADYIPEASSGKDSVLEFKINTKVGINPPTYLIFQPEPMYFHYHYRSYVCICTPCPIASGKVGNVKASALHEHRE